VQIKGGQGEGGVEGGAPLPPPPAGGTPCPGPNVTTLLVPPPPVADAFPGVVAETTFGGADLPPLLKLTAE
jgi:hypothetical protein